VASDSIIAIDSNVIVNQAVSIDGESFVFCQPAITANIGFDVDASSSATVFATLKWVEENDTEDSWTGSPDTDVVWVLQTDTDETWTVQTDTEETWTPVAETSVTWH